MNDSKAQRFFYSQSYVDNTQCSLNDPCTTCSKVGKSDVKSDMPCIRGPLADLAPLLLPGESR